jgi:LysM repeat protein
MALSQKWKDTVNGGKTDSRWDEYDAAIKKEVDRLNTQLASTPQFAKVDWLKVKAILWTESGGPDNASWKKRVMQIGNPGDPAYGVLKDAKEGSPLIVSAALKIELKTGIDKPEVNIAAAIAYLYTRLATFEEKSLPDAQDTRVYDHKVVGGDTLWGIAKKVGTTVPELQTQNPSAKTMIKPGQVLKYRKASMG